jgi:hypothetical protein
MWMHPLHFMSLAVVLTAAVPGTVTLLPSLLKKTGTVQRLLYVYVTATLAAMKRHRL